jgi:hypothetical protein
MRIYGLIDPRTGLIRYVGRTGKTLAARFRTHLADTVRHRDKDNHRLRWIRKLLRLELAPSIVLLEECDGDGVREECFHIKLARSDGLPLTNSTDGGESPMVITDELREKLRRAATGKRWSSETRKKMLEYLVNRELTPEALAKIVAVGKANRGKMRSAETRQKYSAAKRGRKLSPEVVAKMSEIRKGKPWSDSRRANMVTVKGRAFTDEHKQNLSAANKGRLAPNKKFTPEQERAICDEYNAGGITKDIAEKNGKKHWMISAILRRHGIPPRKHSLTSEQVEKMRASKTGKPQSPEHRTKRIAASNYARQKQLAECLL